MDYLGLAHELKTALATYTESGGTGQTTLEQERAVALMQEKYEICCGILHGFDWSDWASGDAHARIGLLPAAQEQVLSCVNGKERFLQAVRDLSKAFALAVPHEKALAIRKDNIGLPAAAEGEPGSPHTARSFGKRGLSTRPVPIGHHTSWCL